MPDFITAEYLCYLLAPIVALIVQALKGVEIIQRYPKVTVAVLSPIVSAIAGWTMGGLDWSMLVECTLVPMIGAVGVYEWVVKPAAEMLEAA
ncbi:MAG: hypothetical protein ACYC28_14340 [Longimicrobiales bacterium]